MSRDEPSAALTWHNPVLTSVTAANPIDPYTYSAACLWMHRKSRRCSFDCQGVRTVCSCRCQDYFLVRGCGYDPFSTSIPDPGSTTSPDPAPRLELHPPSTHVCAQAALRADPSTDISVVALDLPCTFFMLRAAASLPVVEPVARHFSWAPAVDALAKKVADGIAAATGAFRYAFQGLMIRNLYAHYL